MNQKQKKNSIPDSSTGLYGIIGHPVAHSLSPVMHNSAFKATGLNNVYLAFDVTDLEDAVKGIRALGIKGVSVTVPHKESVMKFLDEIDPVAKKIGAVNTIINRNGRLLGTNTDWIGAVKALEEGAGRLDTKKVLVLGAGGSARAVVAGLTERGARVLIANRTLEKAKDLAEQFDARWYSFDELPDVEANIVVNTTSVGMEPNQDTSLIPAELLPKYPIVMDIVYSPLKTKLLKEAEATGCKTITGLRMLLFQAVAQFELWTGMQVPAEVMERALYKTLKKSNE